jgi:hypothetical protein
MVITGLTEKEKEKLEKSLELMRNIASNIPVKDTGILAEGKGYQWKDNGHDVCLLIAPNEKKDAVYFRFEVNNKPTGEMSLSKKASWILSEALHQTIVDLNKTEDGNERTSR